jgi:hypothetical protein
VSIRSALYDGPIWNGSCRCRCHLDGMPLDDCCLACVDDHTSRGEAIGVARVPELETETIDPGPYL